MGQNNDTTEHGDLQGQQGVIKNHQKSAYLGTSVREGRNVFGTQNGKPDRPRADGEDAPHAIPLPDETR